MNGRKSQLRFAKLASALLALALVLMLFSMAAADSPTPGAAAGPNAPTGTEDGGGMETSYEVGAEFPSADAPPWGPSPEDRPIHKDSAWNFYNKMRAAGYTGSRSFIWGNNMAWETDLKRAALGGFENSWIDNADIYFLHSHGNNGLVWFPWGHTDTDLVTNDCQGAWGDKDVEWVGLKTCLSLSDALGWASCMNGVHTIAGFTTVSASNEFGGMWADQLLGWKVNIWPFGDIWLRTPKTVTQAWFTTCDDRTDGATARVIAEDTLHFNDHVWLRGGPVYGDIVNWPKYYMDHTCYHPRPKAVEVSLLAAMPSQTVLPRTVDMSFAKSLAATLNVNGTLALSPDGSEYALTDTSNAMTRTLSVQTATGGYIYQDTSQLWVPPVPGQPYNLPDPTQAARLANAYFLANAQSLPGGTNFDPATQHVQTDQMITMNAPTSALAPEAPTGVNVMVAYGRSLNAVATTAKGADVAVNVSVGGPGGATKMYLGGQAAAPVGLSGGSRDVQAGNPVTLKDVNSTWEAFLADPQLSVLEIGLVYDAMVRHPVSDTFAYFEQPLDVPQKELIPTWVYNVDFMQGGQLVTNGTVYVPASPLYYPPKLTIDSPISGTVIFAGQIVDLKATTTGGNGPLTYEWTSSTQGVLGHSEDIKAILLSKGRPDEPPAPSTLSLMVTDANGLIRTANVIVAVVGQPQWLPMLQR